MALIVFDGLWKVMEERGVSAYQLREKYDIDSRTVRRPRANQNVTTDTLDKLCEILECDLEDIATRVSNSREE